MKNNCVIKNLEELEIVVLNPNLQLQAINKPELDLENSEDYWYDFSINMAEVNHPKSSVQFWIDNGMLRYYVKEGESPFSHIEHQMMRHFEKQDLEQSKSGFRPVENINKVCQDSQHNPPTHLHVPYGYEYVHKCPTCGSTQIIQSHYIWS